MNISIYININDYKYNKYTCIHMRVPGMKTWGVVPDLSAVDPVVDTTGDT